MRKQLFTNLRLSHTQTIALGFFLIILLGSGLLMLPIAQSGAQPIHFLDALFTATSATCVTGLIVADTYTAWSVFGQLVILGLIQIGGLGFMTIATRFLLALHKTVGLRSKSVLSESINSTQIGGILRLTKMIIWFTFVIEGTGALILTLRFIPVFGPWRGLYYGIFHAVSAFCNAGFDLMGIMQPYTSLVPFRSDFIVNVTIMLLIIIGGLGFLVWDDIFRHGLHFRKYSLHSKIVLTVTCFLVFGGAVLFYLFELSATGKGADWGTQVLSAFFNSVTPRTAGFNTTDPAALSGSSKLLMMVFMFIGGSPGSTAGGIKTTTAAVLLFYASSIIRSRKTSSVYGRRLNTNSLRKASAVFFTNLILVLVATLTISCLCPTLDLVDILFETFSAMGTVGISTGITRSLTTASRLIIIFLMYCGRVGSLSFATALAERGAPPPVRDPVEEIIIG